MATFQFQPEDRVVAESDLHPGAVEVEEAMKRGSTGSAASDAVKRGISGLTESTQSNWAAESMLSPTSDHSDDDVFEECYAACAEAEKKQPSPRPKALPDCLLRTNFSALRFRKSCYFDATVRWGVQGFTPYNHMLLPIGFTSPEEEYRSLCNDVCLWDVAAERQVELAGADALKLAEMVTPRPLGTMKAGEARYAMITDEAGMVLNDPVVLKLAEDRYWFSLADSDILLWIKGLAIAHRLDVCVTEPAVSPLAVQGPKSLALMRDLFGDWVDELKFYHFKAVELDGVPMLLARSGWSPERGYELFLQDESRGDELWERIMSAGKKYNIRPGVPNQIRRIEGGMLSYGSDMTPEHSVLELGLPKKWCSPDKAADFVGKAALQRLVAEGAPRRSVVGLQFSADEGDDAGLGPLWKPWKVQAADSGDAIGFVTSVCFSPAVGAHLAIATIDVESSADGTAVTVETTGLGPRSAVVRKLPFLPRKA